MSQIILDATDVVKRYGKFQAVAGVNLRVRSNTVHSVIGPNGAGKTTLFHALTGTVPLTSGSIVLNGADVSGMADYERVQLGMARSFQVTSLFLGLTVRENLRLAAQGVQPRKAFRSEEHTSELQSRENLVCRLLPEKKNR